VGQLARVMLRSQFVKVSAISRKLAWIAVSAILLGSCAERVPPEVAVYTSVDRDVAAPIFAEFSKSTGVIVRATYGAEAARSQELKRAIEAQREQPQCDLFWNREILNTLSLDRNGLLRPFAPTAESEFPASSRSPQNTWYGVTSVARVLVINTNQIAKDRQPKSLEDLKDPQWYERTAIAKPLYGPSAVHAACIFQALGDAKAQEFFLAVKRTARILADDREVAHEVAAGRLAFGLTNSSDAEVELAAGAPLKIIYPDQGEGQLGTLFIPSTVAIVRNSPHPEPAERLLEFLLSADVAKQLADGPSALIPLRMGVIASDRVKTPSKVRAMNADFSAASEQWDSIAKFLQAEFAAGN
jgi:iron(III) transport system substrate-binding protein